MVGFPLSTLRNAFEDAFVNFSKMRGDIAAPCYFSSNAVDFVTRKRNRFKGWDYQVRVYRDFYDIRVSAKSRDRNRINIYP